MIRCLLCAAIVCASTSLAAQDGEKPFKIDSMEEKLLELTNAERKKEALPPLKPSMTLFKLARDHSQNMAKQGKLDHELDEKSPFDRMRDAGYRFGNAGENIAYGTENLMLSDIIKMWMDSEGHRANILHKDYVEIGLGIARNDQGEIYYTQVFARPVR